jgi:hypothetical protein
VHPKSISFEGNTLVDFNHRVRGVDLFGYATAVRGLAGSTPGIGDIIVNGKAKIDATTGGNTTNAVHVV